MAANKGDIKTSANYDVRAQKPMEARREKPRKVDLITKESWSYDGNTVYAHEGLQVWVVEEGKTYVLKDLSKMFEPDYSGWEMQLTDAHVAKVATSGQYSDLSGKPTFATVNGKRIDQGGNIEIEGGGITEEKEVYIGSDTPPEGAKVWIDPTGNPSQPSDYATKEYVDNAIYNVLNSSF